MKLFLNQKGFAPIIAVFIGLLFAGAIGIGMYYTGQNSSRDSFGENQETSSGLDTEISPEGGQLNQQIEENYTNPVSPLSGGSNPINSIFVVNVDSLANVALPSFEVNGNTYAGVNTFISYMSTLPSGTYNISVSAPGYETSTGIRFKTPEHLSSLTINLSPLTQAHTCPHAPSNSTAFAFCGYLVDASHNSLSGVSVSSPSFPGVSATTASDGYFDLQFLPLQNYDCGSPVTFSYSKAGYKTLNYIINGPWIYQGGDMGTRLIMSSGSGIEQQNLTHGMCQ